MVSMNALSEANEDWGLLTRFFPADWRALALETGALRGLRKDKSEEACLRTLMIHVGCGYSLRETVVRAKRANLASLSDVALLKRLRKSKDWLHALCCRLFEERSLHIPDTKMPNLCLVDGTHVKEPGKTGSLWRVHYCLRWPSLRCDYFKLTPSQGLGNGERPSSSFPSRLGITSWRIEVTRWPAASIMLKAKGLH